MNNIFLSKSRYCQCVQCEKILWLNKYKPESSEAETNETVFERGRQVGELAKELFGDYEDVAYDENINFRVEKTAKLLEDKPNVITEASFIYDNNFCSVDILKNDFDGVEIYEVKSSTKVKDIYVDDVAYQYFVLSNLGLNIKRACIVYINKEYVRFGELDIEELFNFEDVTSDVKEKQVEIRENIDSINRFMEVYTADNEPDSHIGINCFNPYS